MVYGPGPSTQGESKGPSRGGLWPNINKTAFGHRRGYFSPRQTHSTLGGTGKNGIRSKLRRKIWNIQEKLLLLPFNALNLTEPPSLAFTNLPNNFEYRLMGQVSALEMLTLYVDEGQWTHASIKGKISNLKGWLGKMAKKREPPSPPPRELL